MSLDTLPDLRCLLLWDGQLFGNVEGARHLHPMEVHSGSARTPFTICTAPPPGLFHAPQTHPFDSSRIVAHSTSSPAEDTPGDVYACWVNHLADWTLQGSETIQLMINRHDAACEVHLNSPITVPHVMPGTVFEAWLGAHRARARLRLTMTDPTTGEEKIVRLPFDTACPGGTQRSGFAHLRHPLPDGFSACRIDISVEYLGHLDDGRGVEPFLFLADMRATSDAPQGETSHVTSPEWLLGDTPLATGDWVSAPLPETVTPGQSIAIKMGTDSFPFTPMAKPAFSVRENYGHTLVCSASDPLDLILCIDGTPVEPLRISGNDTVVRLPTRYLNGHVRHLSIKDPSGSVVLFERHQMMPAIITPADVMQRESAAPFPGALFAQTPHRYAALADILARSGPKTDHAQLLHALRTVEGGHANVTLSPLRFPPVKDPDVSIIVPAHDQIEVTYLALCALLLAQNDTCFEVIVVDDASTDDTARIEEFVKGITVLRHTAPQRFIRACNAGAAKAKGQYIALLNNDTEVTNGWLDALVDAFDRFDNVGLVGSKLLYPDGDLQDAGGIVWGSGNPWNYGNRQNPNDPRFCYARQVDYLSGAALMIPRALWQQVGGLSGDLEPMYFEDTDLAFKIRDAGYTTWFIPSSVVYHFEGMTSGTDVTSGMKRYQEINRPKFKRRWASAFASHGAEGQNPDLEKDRGIVGRVLFIDYAPPRADKDAGSYAALQEMQLVQSLGYKVTFVSTNMAHLGRYTETLQRDGIEVIHAPFFMNVTEYLNAHAADFAAFYITRYYVAQAVLQQIRTQAPQAKILFNNADLHFLRELRTARSEGDAGKLDRARQTRSEELDIIANVDVVLSYTEVEHSVIHAYTDGAAKVIKCPWVVDVPETVPDRDTRSGMSFLGSFRHHPNTEGITWFARNVMPQLAAAGSDATLTIYGSGMGPDIKDLQTDTITAHGFITDAKEAFDSHLIFVAPLLSGAGIKGKVLAALARGIPCIISPIAAEGIGLRAGHDCLIVEQPRDWVDAIVQLQNDPALWHELSANAQRYLAQAYSFDCGRAQMRRAFEAADMYGSRP